MQTKEVTVRLQALDGTWEISGRDRKCGIWPENVSLTSDLWGSATASFELRRNPRRVWPDLGAYTPVEIVVAGVVVWAGRISDTPSRDSADRVISVQCKGWQYHLDDDIYQKTYVHSRIGDWRDARTFPTTDLNNWRSTPSVAADSGVVSISWPAAQTIKAGTQAGVILDLGPNVTAASISVDWTSSDNHAGMGLYARAATDPSTLVYAFSDAFANVLNTSAASGTSRGTFPTPGRYVAVYAFNNSGGDLTPGSDVWFKLIGIRVFTNDAYRSTDSSVLTASTVITDALAQATILLNTDRTGITATSFSIPDLVLDGPKSPREVWSAVNAYHDYIGQIDVRKRPVFKAKPTTPMFEVGAWSPLELEDQSANSGDDIYNRVLVTGTMPDGSPLWVERSAGQQPGVSLSPVSSPAADNPSFATDAASWTNVTRDTTTYDTAPASGAVLSGRTATETFTGTFAKGRTYVLLFRIKFGSSSGPYDTTFKWGTGADLATLSVPTIAVGGFTTQSITWTPSADRTGVTLSFDTVVNTNIDSLGLYVATPTLVDRRVFKRTKELPVQAALTTTAAQTIGDLWLAAHKTTPYKGTFKLTGDRAVRDPSNGTPIQLEQLLLHTGELIRDTNAIDPDTGGIGRDGRIAQVTYTPATEEAVVTLDNSRASYEALLARFDLLTSSR